MPNDGALPLYRCDNGHYWRSYDHCEPCWVCVNYGCAPAVTEITDPAAVAAFALGGVAALEKTNAK